MKSKTFLVTILAIGLIAATSAVKVTICHNVDNNPVTISIAVPAAVAHFIQHPSDTLGDCNGGEDDDFNK